MKANRKYYYGKKVVDVGMIMEIPDGRGGVSIYYDGLCHKNGELKADNVRIYWRSTGQEVGSSFTPEDFAWADETAQKDWELNHVLHHDGHWEKMR